MSLGHMYLSAVLEANSLSSLLMQGDISALFKPSEIEAYEFIRAFVKKHGALPAASTIYTHLGTELTQHTEPPTYYLELMQTRHVDITLKKALIEADKLLDAGNKQPEKALEVLTQCVLGLAMQKSSKQITDFRNAYDIIIPAYQSKFVSEAVNGLMYGWPTMDKATGGLRAGDMVSFVGRPGKGKTFQMLYAALYGWNQAGQLHLALESAAGSDTQMEIPDNGSRMFVSMEMSTIAIMERMAAMQTHVGMTKLKNAAFGTQKYNQLKKGLTEVHGFGEPFWIIDGNLAATVEDIWLLQRQLKPDATFIDGGYLVKHPTERDRFRRVAENADLMKGELASEAPLTVSWQFAKSASKKKKGEKVDGDDVGYSDAIFQVSSILAGLFEPDTVETLKERQVEILKGRGGETGGFRTNWDFVNMDFSEIVGVDLSELQFI